MRIMLALLLTILASPAAALSCAPYNAVQAFLDAQAAPDPYLVVLGTLTFDEGHLPKVDWDKQEEVKPDNVFSANLAGHSLARRGFVLPFREEITVNVQCTGPWCASLSDQEVYLAFLKQTETSFELVTHPCGGYAFGDPDPDILSRVKACVRGSGCDPDLSKP